MAAHRIDYAAYIASAAWRLSPARLAEIAAAGGRCRLCNEGPPAARIEVHHRTYARLGREQSGDLTTLCSICHRTITDMLRARRYAVYEPQPPRDVSSPLAGRTLVVSEWIATCRTIA